MDTIRKFIQFVKVDAQKREVWGIVTAEVPDKDDEVCDYAGSKPYYQAVIDEMGKASNGGNFFPLREMHGLTAAGKCVGFEFRDTDKEIFMGFKVVDDGAWKKVDEQVYTGFSQGGRLVGNMTPDPVFKGCKRYTANPSEVSLVDNPCLAAAHFAYVTKTGELELRKFQRTELPAWHDRVAALESQITLLKAGVVIMPTGATKRYAGKDLPSSSFAFIGKSNDPNTWKLPIDDAAAARRSLARCHQTSGISTGQKADVHARIVAACQKFGVNVEAEQKKTALVLEAFRKSVRIAVNRRVGKGLFSPRLLAADTDLGKLHKGMYAVSNMAFMLEDLAVQYYMNVQEQMWEEDDSEVPAMLQQLVEDFAATLIEMTDEETKEILAGVEAFASRAADRA